MAKHKADTEVEETDEDSVKPKTVTLSRTYTYEGRHYGPGEVEINEKDQDRTDLIARSLKRRERQLNEAQAKRLGGRRKDKSVTGVVHKGTSPEFDQDAPNTSSKSVKKRAREAAEEDEDLYPFNEDELPASALWDRTDDELKEGGLKKKQIRAIRAAHEESQVGGGGSSKEQEEAADAE